MKKSVLLVAIMMSSNLFAETQVVDCKSQTYFSENSCTVCQTSGEAVVANNKIILPQTDVSWKNKSTEMNQNFYQSNQTEISILTNIATAPTKDLEDTAQWWSSIVWKDIDDVKSFALATEKTVTLKTIEDKKEILVTDIKTNTSPYLVVKIPVTYSEVKSGSFNESAPKTTNYCVSYTPKITTPTTGTAGSEETDTEEAADETTIEDTVNDVLSETTEDTEDTEDDPADTVPEVIEDETAEEDIPSYDANVSLNSAGTDPTLNSATDVETGPEEIFILFAACLMGILLYPKVNQIFQKN